MGIPVFILPGTFSCLVHYENATEIYLNLKISVRFEEQ